MLKSILGNLLSFDKLICDQIIKLLYYVGLVAIALRVVRDLYLSFTSGIGNFIPLLLWTLVGAIIAVLLWRVLCEVIILIFRIYARLGDINKALGGKNTEAAIPGDDVLQEVRDAALKAKAAATEKAKGLKSSISKDADEVEIEELKPASDTPVKKPAPKKTSTAAKKSTSTAKKTTSTTKKTTITKKTTPKK